MKIKTKILFFVISLVLLIGLSSVIAAVNLLNKTKEREAHYIKKTLISGKKEKLKDIVNNSFSIVEDKYRQTRDKEFLKKKYHEKLKSYVDTTITGLEEIYSDKSLTYGQKVKLSKKLVSSVRFDNGNGYLFSLGTNGIMKIHPIKPSLVGKNLLGLKDSQNTFFIKEMAEKGKNEGSGFVTYLWPRPGFAKPVEKITYVRIFKPWNWVIGTGVYIESEEDKFKKETMDILSTIRYGENRSGYLWIHDVNTSEMYLHINKKKSGKNFCRNKGCKGQASF